jgi:competence protein ComEC
VRVSRKAEHWSLAATLDAIRSWAERIVRRAVGPERAPLATAMLLGNRNTLPGEVTDRFRTTGMIHLLVVSGLHVGIVVGGLFAAKWGGLLPRRVALLAIIVAVVFYTLLTGANPPVVRAAVLAVLVCLAMWTGRTVVSLNSLAAAAIVVLALNPADLFRTGPQLSFLAVATLIWIGSSLARRARLAAADPLTRLVEQSRPWPIRAGKRFLRWNVALLVATTAVWLVALPLVMNQMHVVSPVAVIVSPLVWPLVTIALVSGVAVVVVGLVLPPLAGGFGTICDWSLLGLEQLVNSAEQMPGGHFWVAGPANWWVIGFYLGVVALFVTGGRWLAVRWQVALLSLWIIAGLLPPLTASFRNEHRLECGFIAVGHGVCVCLHTPDGKTLLYDAGSLSSPEFAAGAIAGYLWDRGVQRIDGIVLSHADVDHFNAVPDLCARFAVSAVYVSPLMFDGFGATASEQSAPLTLRALLEERDIAVHEIWGGDRLRLGNDVVIEVLHPPQQGVFGSDNADSLTLGIEFAGRRVLLPGDLESPGLEAVMAELPYDCDVLLAPHHGSARSDPPGFAAWCQPELVVISGGGGPAVAGVANTYQSAGAQVLRTDRDGAVQVAIDADRVSAAGWLHADQQ